MDKLKHHKNVLLTLVLGALLSLTVSEANASPVPPDSIQTYTLNGVTVNGGTLSGFFISNLSNGLGSVDITATLGPNYTSTASYFSNLAGNAINGAMTVDFVSTAPGYDISDLHLVFDTQLGSGITVINTALSYDCYSTTKFVCSSANNDEFPLTNGTVTNIPEPAPIALLGVGLLGLIAARRRRSI